MVTMIPQIPEPPTPQDPPAQFNQKAADSWAGLYAAVPKMNQQAGEIEQIGAAATAAAGQAAVDSDLALGYKNEAGAARTAAQGAAATAGQHAATATQAGNDAAQAAVRAEEAAAAAGQRVPMTGMSGAAILPSGPASDRPDPQLYQGQFLLRGNSELGKLEWYDWGALAWKPLGGGSSELFNYAWHNGPRSSIAVTTPGRIPTDGQQITLLQYPVAVQAVLDGKQNSVPAAEWLSTPSKRNCWGIGDGWVYVPDLNGARADTGKPFYLRGGPDGLNGTSVLDAMQGHVHAGGNDRWTGGQGTGGSASNGTNNSPTGGPVSDGVHGAPRVADETRVKTAYAVMTVRVFSEVSNAGAVDAAQLATQLAVLDAKVQELDANTGYTIIHLNGGTAAAPGTVAANSRYVTPNPFPGMPVICEVEIRLIATPRGDWFKPGWSSNNGVAYGVSAGLVGDSVIVQTGSSGVTAAAVITGATVNPGGVVATAEVRVKVWKLIKGGG